MDITASKYCGFDILNQKLKNEHLLKKGKHSALRFKSFESG
jgi:hypothetical protein